MTMLLRPETTPTSEARHRSSVRGGSSVGRRGSKAQHAAIAQPVRSKEVQKP